jgi:hypothetical protein
MDRIIALEGADLEWLLSAVRSGEPISRIRFCTDDADTIKIKINGGMWTPPMGRRDNS